MPSEKESENPQLDLLLTVLKRLDEAGVLDELILVGSWCAYFYNDYFGGKARLSTLRTRDMDFLINRPPRFKAKIQMPELLRDLGFLPDRHPDGSVSMAHPDLIIDFLIAERGKGSDKAIPVDDLGIRAQPLRFMDFLSGDAIVVNSNGLDLRLPHPACFALHKLVVSVRRREDGKKEKDVQQGLEILRALIKLGREKQIQAKFAEMPDGWKKDALKVLKSAEAHDILAAIGS